MIAEVVSIIEDAIKECEEEMKHYNDPETGDGYEYEYEKGKKAAYEFVLTTIKEKTNA